jgi:DNA-binding SARP family transcriptional activator
MLGDFMHALVAGEVRAETPLLYLFGGPLVTLGGRPIEVPEGSKRLLVFVALHREGVERRYAAGSLWPVGDDLRAAGCLRSALWRLRRAGIDLLAAGTHGLRLREDVIVDIHLVRAWAARLRKGSPSHDDLSVLPWGLDALDLLSGWYDDWVLMERERIRQQLLHALEALSHELVKVRRCAEAVEAAMMAVSAEPLRESAQRMLIEAHLAEGNWVEARRSYQAYHDLLGQEFGTEPAPALAAMVPPARGQSPLLSWQGLTI